MSSALDSGSKDPRETRTQKLQQATGVELEKIYREHVAMLWRSLAAFGVPRANREDAVHEVFVVLYRQWSRYDPERSLEAWLFGICRNVALHYHRKNRRSRGRESLLPRPQEVQSPDEHIERIQAAKTLQRFLDTLDDDKRTAFIGCELEGLTLREVAENCSININTLAARVRAARKLFQRFIEEQQPKEKTHLQPRNASPKKSRSSSEENSSGQDPEVKA